MSVENPKSFLAGEGSDESQKNSDKKSKKTADQITESLDDEKKKPLDITSTPDNKRKTLDINQLEQEFEDISKLRKIERRDIEGHLDAVLGILQHEPESMRPKDKKDRPGGLIELKKDIPTILVPDLHGKRNFLLQILEFQDDKGTTNLEKLIQGDIQIAILGDAINTESEKGLDEQMEAQREHLINGKFISSIMDKEAADSLGTVVMIQKLKELAPENIHYIRGDHEDTNGAYGNITKGGVEQAYLLKSYIQENFGQDFLKKYSEFEESLPYMAKGETFIASHTIPGSLGGELPLKDIIDKVINYRDNPKDVYFELGFHSRNFKDGLLNPPKTSIRKELDTLNLSTYFWAHTGNLSACEDWPAQSYPGGNPSNYTTTLGTPPFYEDNDPRGPASLSIHSGFFSFVCQVEPNGRFSFIDPTKLTEKQKSEQKLKEEQKLKDIIKKVESKKDSNEQTDTIPGPIKQTPEQRFKEQSENYLAEQLAKDDEFFSKEASPEELHAWQDTNQADFNSLTKEQQEILMKVLQGELDKVLNQIGQAENGLSSKKTGGTQKQKLEEGLQYLQNRQKSIKARMEIYNPPLDVNKPASIIEHPIQNEVKKDNSEPQPSAAIENDDNKGEEAIHVAEQLRQEQTFADLVKKIFGRYTTDLNKIPEEMANQPPEEQILLQRAVEILVRYKTLYKSYQESPTEDKKNLNEESSKLIQELFEIDKKLEALKNKPTKEVEQTTASATEEIKKEPATKLNNTETKSSNNNSAETTKGKAVKRELPNWLKILGEVIGGLFFIGWAALFGSLEKQVDKKKK